MKRDATMIERLIELSIRNRWAVGLMVGMGDGSIRLVSSDVSPYSRNLALNPSDGLTFDSSW